MTLRVIFRDDEMDYTADVTFESHGLALGANLVLCRSVVDRFEDAVTTLHGVGFHRLTLLRYKPPAPVNRWRAECPAPASHRSVVASVLSRAAWSRLYSAVPHPATGWHDCGGEVLRRTAS